MGMVGTTTGTTIGITTRAAPRPLDDAIMRMLTRLLGCAVLLSSSQSDEEAGRIGESKDKDVVGLIRPVKDLSIWLDEDQVKLFSGIRHMMIHMVGNASRGTHAGASLATMGQGVSSASVWYLVSM